MAFRTVTAGAATLNTTAGTSTIAFAMPTGTGGGILALAGINTGTYNAAGANLWPAGGTQIADLVAGGSDHCYVYWWPASAAPTAGFSISITTANRSQGILYRVSGSDAWTPEITSATTGNMTTSVVNNITPPAFSPAPSWNSGGATDTTWMTLMYWRSGTDQLTSGPPSYTLSPATPLYTLAASGNGLAPATRQQNTTATETPGAYTITPTGSRAYVTATLAMKSVAAAAVKPRSVYPPLRTLMY